VGGAARKEGVSQICYSFYSVSGVQKYSCRASVGDDIPLREAAKQLSTSTSAYSPVGRELRWGRQIRSRLQYGTIIIFSSPRLILFIYVFSFQFSYQNICRLVLSPYFKGLLTALATLSHARRAPEKAEYIP
jgi:hypothetical protein